MSIDPDLMDIAVSIEKDIPSRITGENRMFIRSVIARELTKARSQAYEEIAQRILSQRYVPEDMRKQLSQAIRQHSQKGEDK